MAFTWMVLGFNLVLDAWDLKREKPSGAPERAGAWLAALVPILIIWASGQFGYSDGFPYCLVAETNKTKFVISRSYLQVLFFPAFVVILGVLGLVIPNSKKATPHVVFLLLNFIVINIIRL